MTLTVGLYESRCPRTPLQSCTSSPYPIAFRTYRINTNLRISPGRVWGNWIHLMSPLAPTSATDIYCLSCPQPDDWSLMWPGHDHPKIRRGSPRARAISEGGVGTNWRFSTNMPPYLRKGHWMAIMHSVALHTCFGANHNNLNEDRPIQSAAKM